MASVKSLLSSGTCTTEDVLNHPNVLQWFNLPKSKLIFYLFDHIDDVIAVASDPGHKQRSVALTIAIGMSQKFSNEMMASHKFIEHLDFLLSEKNSLNLETSIVISRMLCETIIASNVLFLVGHPDRANFFRLLVEHIDSPPVNTLLRSMTNDHRRVMVSFFESANASQVLFNNLATNNPAHNQRILFLLTDIISCVESNSCLMDPFLVPDNIDKIVSMGVKSDNALFAAHCYRLLVAVFLHRDITNVPIEPALSHLELLCRAAMKNDGKFFADKTEIVTLVTLLCDAHEEYPECAQRLLAFLFDQVFAFPTHSLLHLTFKSMLERFVSVSASGREFVYANDMHARILRAFADHDRTNACFFGVLHIVADLIDGIVPTDEEVHCQWSLFITNEHESYLNTISCAYGQCAIESSSDDDEIIPDNFFSDD